MRDIRVAKPYARALYEAASEQNALADIVRDIDKLRELIEQSQEFAQLISSPILSPQFKSETFQQIFADATHPLTINFLKLLALKQRERYLIAIMDVFSAIVDEAAGRSRCEGDDRCAANAGTTGATQTAIRCILGKTGTLGDRN